LLGKRTQDLAGKLDDFEFRATYYKKYKMVELSFKNDMPWHEICFCFCYDFSDFFQKMQMLNYPESFCRAIIFSSGLRGRRRTYLTILKLADHALFA
jgi:hypothetical protein